jgi:hypothetical protein
LPEEMVGIVFGHKVVAFSIPTRLVEISFEDCTMNNFRRRLNYKAMASAKNLFSCLS